MPILHPNMAFGWRKCQSPSICLQRCFLDNGQVSFEKTIGVFQKGSEAGIFMRLSVISFEIPLR